MNINILGAIASIGSLILAIIFWYLASKQAEKADRTLNEIKDKILSWQNDMNNAAINLIEARPEVIAQKVSLEEAKNNSDFMNRLADTIEKLASEANEDSTGYKIAIVKELLEHQKTSVLGSEEIKAKTILAQQGVKSEV